MTEENKNFVKEFDKCPACGSPERFFENIVKEMQEKGMAEANWQFFLESKQGPVATQDMLNKAPVGLEFPGFSFATDICQECGCIYARYIARGIVKKQTNLATPQGMPNRAQRRRQQRDGLILPGQMHNPLLS